MLLEWFQKGKYDQRDSFSVTTAELDGSEEGE